MKKRLSRLVGIAGLLLNAQGAFGLTPTNFSLPHEGYLWTSSKYLVPDYYDKEDPKTFRLSCGAGVEYGFSPKGYDRSGNNVLPYQIYYPSENLLDANFPADKQNMIAAFSNMTLLGGNSVAKQTADSGLRFKMADGVSVKETDIMLWSRLALPIESMPGQIEVSAYCPVKFMDVSSVSWDPVDEVASMVPPIGGLSYLSAAEKINLLQTGNSNNLTAASWNKVGLGDLNVLISWKHHYTQVNDALSSVGLYAQSGLSMPTGSRNDLDKVLALPFGYDGAAAIPMSLGINLHFSKNLRLCGSVDAAIFFGERANRMVRTKESEGALWLGKESNVYRTPGMLLGFNALFEVISSCKRYSLGFLYSFLKKAEDKYTSDSKSFNLDIQNKSEFALEKSCHNVTFRASVDLKEISDSNFAPSLSFSYKYPLKGERMVLFKTVKIEASINF